MDNKKFNPEEWYNQLYQAALQSVGKEEAEEILQRAKRQQWASPYQTPQEAVDLDTM